MPSSGVDLLISEWILIDSVNTFTCVTTWTPMILCSRLNMLTARNLHVCWIAQMFSALWFSEFRCCACRMWTEEVTVGYCDFKTILWLCECSDEIPVWQTHTVLSSNPASSDAGVITCWMAGGGARLTVSDAPARHFPRNTNSLLSITALCVCLGGWFSRSGADNVCVGV